MKTLLTALMAIILIMIILGAFGLRKKEIWNEQHQIAGTETAEQKANADASEKEKAIELQPGLYTGSIEPFSNEMEMLLSNDGKFTITEKQTNWICNNFSFTTSGVWSVKGKTLILQLPKDKALTNLPDTGRLAIESASDGMIKLASDGRFQTRKYDEEHKSKIQIWINRIFIWTILPAIALSVLLIILREFRKARE